MNFLKKFSKSLSNENAEQPLAIFGVLSDIQYADIPNTSYGFNRTRYYRNSLTLLANAIKNWQNSAHTANQNLKFVLQLGDLIDSQSIKTNAAEKAVITVLETYESSFNKTYQQANTDDKVPILHIWGNHEMYCFKRSFLLKTPLNTSKYSSFQDNLNNNSNANYYSIEVTHNVVLICLDFYCFSVLGYNKTDPVCQEAREYIRSFHIHNKNKRSLLTSVVCGDYGRDAKYVSYNGALGERQMVWLDTKLNECNLANKKVIVCGHVPVHRKASIDKAIAWDSDEVLETMRKYKNTVVAYLAGHYHPGGYHLDSFGIHHVTFKAILETKPGSNSFATVYIYPKRINFVGVGNLPTFEIKL